MTKLVDIELMKKKYFHCVGTQFDNAIFVAEKEFLVDAYTKADMIGILKEIQMEFEEKIQGYEARSKEHINAAYEASMCGRMFGYCGAKESIQEKIDKLKGEEDEKNQ